MSETKPKTIKPGQLNPLTFSNRQPVATRDKLIDNPGAVHNQCISNTINPNLFNGADAFKAQVLYAYEPPEETSYLWRLIRSTLPGGDDERTGMREVICICRVPELHCSLTDPGIYEWSNRKKFDSIVRHSKFRMRLGSNDSTGEDEMPTPGQIVYVKFLDSSMTYGEVLGIEHGSGESHPPDDGVGARDSLRAGRSSGGGQPSGPLANIDESKYLFPIRPEDRPGKISSGHGMRGPWPDLAKKECAKSPTSQACKRYGKRHMHYGIDVGQPRGTPLIAPCDGTVTWTDTSRGGGGGIQLWLKEEGPLKIPTSAEKGDPQYRVFLYSHLSRIAVKRGDSVNQGDVVAYSGNSGTLTSGPHLHFEVWEGGTSGAEGHTRRNPMDLFPQKSSSPGFPSVDHLGEFVGNAATRLLPLGSMAVSALSRGAGALYHHTMGRKGVDSLPTEEEVEKESE